MALACSTAVRGGDGELSVWESRRAADTGDGVAALPLRAEEEGPACPRPGVSANLPRAARCPASTVAADSERGLGGPSDQPLAGGVLASASVCARGRGGPRQSGGVWASPSVCAAAVRVAAELAGDWTHELLAPWPDQAPASVCCRSCHGCLGGDARSKAPAEPGDRNSKGLPTAAGGGVWETGEEALETADALRPGLGSGAKELAAAAALANRGGD